MMANTVCGLRPCGNNRVLRDGLFYTQTHTVNGANVVPRAVAVEPMANINSILIITVQ